MLDLCWMTAIVDGLGHRVLKTMRAKQSAYFCHHTGYQRLCDSAATILFAPRYIGASYRVLVPAIVVGIGWPWISQHAMCRISVSLLHQLPPFRRMSRSWSAGLKEPRSIRRPSVEDVFCQVNSMAAGLVTTSDQPSWSSHTKEAHNEPSLVVALVYT